jgi:AcrR family transcriptional regulator
MNEVATEKLDTKSRILDAAEKLFAMNGFKPTSLRDITAEAQVNLAAVNYHFQSKESLIEAVIARRMEPIGRRRIEMLDAAGPDASLEQILTAFLAPVFQFKVESVVPLMGRIMSEPDLFLERVYKKHLQPLARRFNDQLAKALPDLPAPERLWRLYFTAGIMTHVLTWSGVLPEMSGGLCDISDRQALLERVVSFVAAGFRSAVPTKGSQL